MTICFYIIFIQGNFYIYLAFSKHIFSIIDFWHIYKSIICKLLFIYTKKLWFCCKLYVNTTFVSNKCVYCIFIEFCFFYWPNLIYWGSSWLLSYGGCIHNYLCNPWLLQLRLWVRFHSWKGVLDTTITWSSSSVTFGWWFFTGTPDSIHQWNWLPG